MRQCGTTVTATQAAFTGFPLRSAAPRKQPHSAQLSRRHRAAVDRQAVLLPEYHPTRSNARPDQPVMHPTLLSPLQGWTGAERRLGRLFLAVIRVTLGDCPGVSPWRNGQTGTAKNSWAPPA